MCSARTHYSNGPGSLIALVFYYCWKKSFHQQHNAPHVYLPKTVRAFLAKLVVGAVDVDILMSIETKSCAKLLHFQKIHKCEEREKKTPSKNEARCLKIVLGYVCHCEHIC